MQPGPSSQGQEPAPSAQGPPVVDHRVFVHAPQYHWHQDGGVDREARAAIEKLHKDTHSFARETVRHGDKLREDVDGLAGVVDQASAALEQQSVFLGELEQQAQGWQEVAQREIGQTRADMVELQGRLTAVESTLQDIQGPQWLTWRAELAAMVDKQLEGFESRLQQKIEGWTETTINACEAMEEKLGAHAEPAAGDRAPSGGAITCPGRPMLESRGAGTLWSAAHSGGAVRFTRRAHC